MLYEGVVPDASLAAMVGLQIGRGTQREVFEYAGQPGYVIKESLGNNHRPNRLEWGIWQKIALTQIASLFGECRAISDTGKYLVMECLQNLAQDDKNRANAEAAANRPSWWTDPKPDAFGKDAIGAIKIRDYATVNCGDGVTGEQLADPALYPIRPYRFVSLEEIAMMQRLKDLGDG